MAYADGAGAGDMVEVMQAERDAAGGSPVRPAGGQLAAAGRQPGPGAHGSRGEVREGDAGPDRPDAL